MTRGNASWSFSIFCLFYQLSDMKLAFLMIGVALMAKLSYACETNIMFRLCMKTGRVAVDACESTSMTSCRCSAQKQLLACYTECGDSYDMFAQEEDQLRYVNEACDFPGAEIESQNRVDGESGLTQQSQGGTDRRWRAASMDSNSENGNTPKAPIHLDEPRLANSHAEAAAANPNTMAPKDNRDLEDNVEYHPKVSAASLTYPVMCVSLLSGIALTFTLLC
ncbi:hypothetical protein CLU79DRAFT_733475 [Phycomyces nitens]|nr:hypothetical protein CLU79DRAFT_733475 [Phycomyces nitens]